MEIVIGIVGIWIAWMTYKKSFPSKPIEPKEEKDNLLAHYKMTQRLSLEVQSQIMQYIDKGNGDKEMYPNVTFQQFLSLAKDEFDKSLSDKFYEELKQAIYTKSNIESMQRMIEQQNTQLTELRNQMIMLNS